MSSVCSWLFCMRLIGVLMFFLLKLSVSLLMYRCLFFWLVCGRFV